ncbi:protein kinase UbiB [Usitatibacter palustris]|uniref:Protein kinase UbiB n=2 Tax=Usitatibacter palustris TaxID=2732487 RepID=A0A6M4H7H0_9PROT|nr:protein kinase UbiB [Usitatibacter palustris]
MKRYKEIAQLLWKYGRSDLVKQMASEEELGIDEPLLKTSPGDPPPEELADDLEALGPTFVKLGQVLSSRADLLPPRCLKALARLQDKVKPFPYADVERIVEAELGVRISKAFEYFNPEPLAAASLGQVHTAIMRDGREVVVKVQRPDVVPQVVDDFAALATVASFLDRYTKVGRQHRFGEIVEELRASIMRELDYQREAQHLILVGKNLAEFDLIQIPQPVPDFSTRRVITMDFVQGRKITKISPLARLEVSGFALADQLFRAYLKQVLVDGIYHADPHAGNVFLTDDGRVALLDLGMVGHTTPAMQNNLLKVLLAMSEGKSEEVADSLCDMSETDLGFDVVGFGKRVAALVVDRQGQHLRESSMGRTLLEVTRSAAEFGVHVPSEFTMLGKTLLQLDEVGRILSPDFDADAAIRRNTSELMTKRLTRDANKGNIATTLLDVKEFLSGLPVRLNRIMDLVAGKDLEMKVRAVDAPVIMEGLLKIANRIASGVILAALIIGASLMMRIETTWTLFGYPGLAIVCFLTAVAGGLYMVANIFIQDRRSERRANRPGVA